MDVFWKWENQNIDYMAFSLTIANNDHVHIT